MSDQPSFICPECGAESFNPNDIAYCYCGRCHKFIDRAKIVLRELIRRM